MQFTTRKKAKMFHIHEFPFYFQKVWSERNTICFQVTTALHYKTHTYACRPPGIRPLFLFWVWSGSCSSTRTKSTKSAQRSRAYCNLVFSVSQRNWECIGIHIWIASCYIYQSILIWIRHMIMLLNGFFQTLFMNHDNVSKLKHLATENYCENFLFRKNVY